MARPLLFGFGIYSILAMLVSASVYFDALGRALYSDRVAGQVRLSEAISRLRGQTDVYRALVNTTATNPLLTLPLNDVTRQAIETELSVLSLTYGAWRVDLVDIDGQIIVSSDTRSHKYSYGRRLTRAALNGRLGYTIDIENNERLIRFSRGVKQDSLKRVVIISANIDALEFEWPIIPEPLVFLDKAGMSVSSNRPYLLLLSNADDPEEASFPLNSPRKMAGAELWTFTPTRGYASEVQVLSNDIPQLQMDGQILLDTGLARASALLQMGLAAALMTAIGLIATILVQQRKRLALEAIYSATLEERVQERTAELRATQNELVEASNLAALGRLSAGLSHELNQPLSAILNFAENGRRLIERSRVSDADENLSHIAEQTRRITRIISNLRAFAKQEHTARDEVDLVDVAQKALDLMHKQILSTGVELHVSLPPKSVFVMAGKVRLEQVIMNLVSNALDAMLDTDIKVLSITLIVKEELASLNVRDSGTGIKDPERVFEPFYTTKELGASKGLGMGLALSFGLVSTFDGQLSCRNVPDGAEFTMTLPSIGEKP